MGDSSVRPSLFSICGGHFSHHNTDAQCCDNTHAPPCNKMQPVMLPTLSCLRCTGLSSEDVRTAPLPGVLSVSGERVGAGFWGCDMIPGFARRETAHRERHPCRGRDIGNLSVPPSPPNAKSADRFPTEWRQRPRPCKSCRDFWSDRTSSRRPSPPVRRTPQPPPHALTSRAQWHHDPVPVAFSMAFRARRGPDHDFALPLS